MMFDWEAFLPRFIHDARGILRKSATKAQMLDRRWDDAPPELRTLLRESVETQAQLDVFFRRLGTFLEAHHPPSTGRLPLRTIVGLARVKKRDRLSAVGAELKIGDLPAATATAELQTVLEELLDNSVTFVARERPLVIRIDARIESEHARIAFTDNASGWDPKLHEAVFAPLQRLDVRGGFGLGLAIARAIVNNAGGSMVATTSPTGSTFEVNLPVNE